MSSKFPDFSPIFEKNAKFPDWKNAFQQFSLISRSWVPCCANGHGQNGSVRHTVYHATLTETEGVNRLLTESLYKFKPLSPNGFNFNFSDNEISSDLDVNTRKRYLSTDVAAEKLNFLTKREY